jgi:hypothetical protein
LPPLFLQKPKSKKALPLREKSDKTRALESVFSSLQQAECQDSMFVSPEIFLSCDLLCCLFGSLPAPSATLASVQSKTG